MCVVLIYSFVKFMLQNQSEFGTKHWLYKYQYKQFQYERDFIFIKEIYLKEKSSFKYTKCIFSNAFKLKTSALNLKYDVNKSNFKNEYNIIKR